MVFKLAGSCIKWILPESRRDQGASSLLEYLEKIIHKCTSNVGAFVINDISAITYWGYKVMGVYSSNNEISTQLLEKQEK